MTGLTATDQFCGAGGMLQPEEIARAMVMHEHIDGSPYVVLGNKRQRVEQYGNAVTPPVMRLLVERVVEALS